MKYNIILACAGGMSTSLLMKKMEKAAADRGIELEICAIGVNVQRIESIEPKDIVLLGPQIRYEEQKLREKFPDLLIQVIDMRDYGTMNGEAVLEAALKVINGI